MSIRTLGIIYKSTVLVYFERPASIIHYKLVSGHIRNSPCNFKVLYLIIGSFSFLTFQLRCPLNLYIVLFKTKLKFENLFRVLGTNADKQTSPCRYYVDEPGGRSICPSGLFVKMLSGINWQRIAERGTYFS